MSITIQLGYWMIPVAAVILFTLFFAYSSYKAYDHSTASSMMLCGIAVTFLMLLARFLP